MQRIPNENDPLAQPICTSGRGSCTIYRRQRLEAQEDVNRCPLCTHDLSPLFKTPFLVDWCGDSRKICSNAAKERECPIPSMNTHKNRCSGRNTRKCSLLDAFTLVCLEHKGRVVAAEPEVVRDDLIETKLRQTLKLFPSAPRPLPSSSRQGKCMIWSKHRIVHESFTYVHV